jgi:hypothetical protein
MESASQSQEQPRISIDDIIIIRNDLQIKLAIMAYKKKHPDLEEVDRNTAMEEWLNGEDHLSERFNHYFDNLRDGGINPNNYEDVKRFFNEMTCPEHRF